MTVPMQITSTTTPTYAPPVTLGDDLESAAATLEVESAAQSRAIERQLQHGEEEAAQHERDQQIQAMRQKADDIRTQGWIDGALAEGEGAAQACNTDAGRAAAAAAQSAGKVADAQLSAGQATDDANSARHAQSAERDEQGAKDANDAADAEQDVAEKAVAAYAQIEQTLASARLAVVQRG
jgi:hypothetical protein